jgi:hypothetical protein
MEEERDIPEQRLASADEPRTLESETVKRQVLSSRAKELMVP